MIADERVTIPAEIRHDAQRFGDVVEVRLRAVRQSDRLVQDVEAGNS
jgi:hypothetical protein